MFSAHRLGEKDFEESEESEESEEEKDDEPEPDLVESMENISVEEQQQQQEQEKEEEREEQEEDDVCRLDPEFIKRQVQKDILRRKQQRRMNKSRNNAKVSIKGRLYHKERGDVESGW
jgi:hypothetical protein